MKFNEKIDWLIQFVEENRELWNLTQYASLKKAVNSLLGENSSEEEGKELLEKLEKAKECYKYIFRYISKQEDIDRLREAGIGKNLGKSTQTRQEDVLLLEKYGISEKIANIIRKKFGSIEAFKKAYIEAFINNNIEEKIPRKILENVKLVHYFDIKSPDLVSREEGMIDFVKEAIECKDSFLIVDGEKIKEYFNLVYSNLNSRDKKIIEQCFGINGEKKQTLTSISEKLGITKARVWEIKEKSFSEFRRNNRWRIECLLSNNAEMDAKEREYFILNYFKLKSVFVRIEPESMENEEKQKLLEGVIGKIEEKQKLQNERNLIRKREIEKIDLDMPIAVLGLSNATYNALYNQKILTVGDLIVNPISKIRKIKKIGAKGFQEIIKNVHVLGLKFRDEINQDIDELDEWFWERIKEYEGKEKVLDSDILKTDIAELKFSTRTYNCLVMSGYRTIGDIANKTVFDLQKIKFLGKKSLDEILGKMYELGISLEIKKEPDEITLGTEIQYLNLASYIVDGMNKKGIITLGDLISRSKEDIMHLDFSGKKCPKKVIKIIHSLGYKFKDEEVIETEGQDIGKATYSTTQPECEEMESILNNIIERQNDVTIHRF